MPLIIQEAREIVDRARQGLRTEVPGLDPTTQRRGFIPGFVIAVSSLLRDFYVAVRRFVERRFFPQNAIEGELETGWWTPIAGITRIPESGSTGMVLFQGERNSVLPRETIVNAGGIQYRTLEDTFIALQRISAQRIEFLPGIGARITTQDPHGLASGLAVSVTGGPDPAYNIASTISVVSEVAFTYPLEDVPAVSVLDNTSAEATFEFGAASVESLGTGLETNVDGGVGLSVSTPPVGIQDGALLPFLGLRGGADLEDFEAFRERILQSLAIDFGQWTEQEIEKVALSVPGVTRVFVVRAMECPQAGQPGEGQTLVAFLRDGDENPIPSEPELQEVRDALLSSIYPAHALQSDLFVVAPITSTVDFNFASITPDTLSMRAAVTQQLQSFFDGLGFEETASELDYLCVIRDTFDAGRGEQLQDFTLNTTGDINVGVNGLARLGEVTF